VGLFRPSRTRRGSDPYYDWKVAAFSLGAAFGLAGIFTNRDYLVLVAVPILALGIALRWLPRRGDTAADDDAADDRADDPDHEPDGGEEPPDESGPAEAPPAQRPPPSDFAPPEDRP
jgi:hypothetical protein